MMLIFTIIVFILILSFLFFSHEFGHFLAAKKSGIPVLEFGFGFPPRLFGWKRGETLYSLNLIPFGAFVKILGDDDPFSKNPKAYWRQSVGKRFFTASGGILSNLIWAWLILTISLWIYAVLPAKNFVIVQEVTKGSPAFTAGIKQGDLLIEANGQTFENSEQVASFTKSHMNQTVSITIKRFGKNIEKKIELSDNIEAPLGVTMVDASSGEKVPFWRAPIESAIILGQAIYLTGAYLGKAIISVFIGPRVPLEVGGPVAVWGFVSQFYTLGFLYVLRLAAFLSLGLAFFNFLPFPALDGGRLAFLVLEKIFGKKVVKPETENIIHGIGFICLIGLMILITYNDVVRLLKK